MNLYDKSLISFIKNDFFYSVKNASFFFCGILSNVFCALYFFIIRDFFGGQGITDLSTLFLSIPFVSIIVLPSLCANSFLSSDGKKTFISPFKVIFVKILNISLQYYLIQLSLFSIIECVNKFGMVDYGQVWTGYIFLLFYSFCASSLCVLFFRLFNSKVLAFGLSAVSIGIFSSIHLLSIHASSSDFLSGIVRTLSFSWHFNNASQGVLSSKDIFFFLISGFLFYFVCVFITETKMGFPFSGKRKIKYILLFLIVIFSYQDSSLFYKKTDCSYNKSRTLSDYGKKIMTLRKSPLSINYYRSKRIFSVFPDAKSVSDFLLEYEGEGVSITEADADEENNKKLLSSYGINPQSIALSGENRQEFVEIYSAIIIEYEGKVEFIPFIISPDSLEYEIDGRLLHLFTEKERFVDILIANGMDIDQDYGYLVPWLNSQGFRTKTIDINKNEMLANNEGDSNLLIVVGSSKLTQNYCQELEEYLASGKKVLFMVSPFDADLQNNWNISQNQNQNLFSLLSCYGINWTGNLLTDKSCAVIRMDSDYQSEGSKSLESSSKYISYNPWIYALPQENALNGITLFWAGETSVENDCTKTLVYSSKNGQSQSQSFNAYGSLFQTYPFDLNENNEKQSQYGLVYELSGTVKRHFGEGTLNASFVLIPDQYFVHSLTLGYSGGFDSCSNYNFIVKELLYLNGEEDLSKLHDKSFTGRPKGLYKITDSKEFSKEKQKTMITVFLLVPLIYVVLYFTVFAFRKYRTKKLMEIVEVEYDKENYRK